MPAIKISYRLELHWSKAEKNKDKVCCLQNAFFSGLVLRQAQKINPSDHITIDLTPQYSKILSSYYFTKLEWGDIEYSGNIVKLKDAVLKGDFINDISRLEDTDYILIDTSKHDGVDHLYNLVYRGCVLNKEGKEYGNA